MVRLGGTMAKCYKSLTTMSQALEHEVTFSLRSSFLLHLGEVVTFNSLQVRLMGRLTVGRNIKSYNERQQQEKR